jgi:hypothetical protein
MLRELTFNQDAIAYIRDQLASDNKLGSYLLELPLERGTVQSLVPADATPEALKKFSVGGLIQRALTEPRVAEFVSAYLAAGTDRLALLEDAGARPDDAYVRASAARYVVHESDVVYMCTPQDGASAITSALRAASSYSFVGTLTVGPMPLATQGEKISADVLRRLALASKHVLVSAYDNESVLIWSGEA